MAVFCERRGQTRRSVGLARPHGSDTFENIEISRHVPCGPANEQTVDMGRRRQFRTVSRIDRAAIQTGQRAPHTIRGDGDDAGVPFIGVTRAGGNTFLSYRQTGS